MSRGHRAQDYDGGSQDSTHRHSSVRRTGAGAGPASARIPRGTSVDRWGRRRRTPPPERKGREMSERLRPRDLAFLAAETPRRRAQRDRRDLRARRLRVRLRAAGGADRRPHLVRAALPAAGEVRARPRWPTRSGSTTSTSTSATTYAGPRCRGPGATTSCASWSARIVSRPLDRQPPALGGLLRRGTGRRPGRGAVEVAPGAGRRRQTVDLGQVLLDLSQEPKTLGPTSWGRRARPRRPAWSSTRSRTP